MSAFEDRADKVQLVASGEDVADAQSQERDARHNAEHMLSSDPDTLTPNIFAENVEQFRKALIAFKDAEIFLKRSEFSDLANNRVFTPAVNELRYYGYHLNKSFTAKCPKDQYEELKRAERHCHRAAYDTVELAMLFNMELIGRFGDDFQDMVIPEVIPNYLSLMENVESHREFISMHSAEDRASYYRDCFDKVLELQRIRRTFENGRPSLNAKRKQAEEEKARADRAEDRADRADKRATRNALLGALATIISVPLTIWLSVVYLKDDPVDNRSGVSEAKQQQEVESAAPAEPDKKQ